MLDGDVTELSCRSVPIATHCAYCSHVTMFESVTSITSLVFQTQSEPDNGRHSHVSHVIVCVCVGGGGGGGGGGVLGCTLDGTATVNRPWMYDSFEDVYELKQNMCNVFFI